jgi:ATP-dependent phosphoenolpyruvate carboxykinase
LDLNRLKQGAGLLPRFVSDAAWYQDNWRAALKGEWLKERRMNAFNLKEHELTVEEVYRNLPPSALYEHAILYEKDAHIAENGALVAYSGVKTGRSPKDKRVVKQSPSEGDVWWGPVNIALEKQHGTRVWLVNTVWSGGAYGTGKRIKLAHTRAIVDAIHSGVLAKAETQRDPVFGLDVVTQCPEVPSGILVPRNAWSEKASYEAAAKKLAGLFTQNFAKYEAAVSAEVRSAGPVA